VPVDDATALERAVEWIMDNPGWFGICPPERYRTCDREENDSSPCRDCILAYFRREED